MYLWIVFGRHWVSTIISHSPQGTQALPGTHVYESQEPVCWGLLVPCTPPCLTGYRIQTVSVWVLPPQWGGTHCLPNTKCWPRGGEAEGYPPRIPWLLWDLRAGAKGTDCPGSDHMGHNGRQT